MRRYSVSKSVGMLALIATGSVLLAVVAARLAPLEETSAPSVSPRVDESDLIAYVGDTACRSCHSSEFSEHQASNHFKALHVMSRAALGAACPEPGRINNSQYALVEKEGKFYFEVRLSAQPDKYQLWPLDYVFGSGRTGLTFVSMLEERNVVEMKMSYFPGTRAWRITPGQEIDAPASAGRTRNLKESHRCLECHSVISRNAFVPQQTLLGVGCESCHGAGRAHIDAIRSGAADRHMERLGALGAEELNKRCGTCHSTEQDIAHAPSALSAKMTYRFQPYGIMQSRCFRESGRQLSCLNCHDPHQNDSTSAAFYERACLSCHSQISSAVHAAHPEKSSGKACPVNPRTDCIRCHMPKRDFKFATQEVSGILMTEHKIAVYPLSPTTSNKQQTTNNKLTLPSSSSTRR